MSNPKDFRTLSKEELAQHLDEPLPILTVGNTLTHYVRTLPGQLANREIPQIQNALRVQLEMIDYWIATYYPTDQKRVDGADLYFMRLQTEHLLAYVNAILANAPVNPVLKPAVDAYYDSM